MPKNINRWFSNAYVSFFNSLDDFMLIMSTIIGEIKEFFTI
jgi:hypothetical protein